MSVSSRSNQLRRSGRVAEARREVKVVIAKVRLKFNMSLKEYCLKNGLVVKSFYCGYISVRAREVLARDGVL